MDLSYNLVFPSLVVYTDNQNYNFLNLQNSAVEIINNYGENAFYSTCSTTVNKKGNVLNDEPFSILQEQIVKTINGFCQLNKIDTNGLYIRDSWLNLYNKTEYQDLHLHADSVISGVIYLESTNEKDLIFQAPWHFHQAIIPRYLENNLNNCHNVEYNSVQGRCYVFLSHLLHRTLPAKERRISLSFNLAYKE